MRVFLPLALLTLLLVLSRVFAAHNIEILANLSPVGALFFCCAAFYPLRYLLIPAIAWLGTYSYTSAVQGYGWNPAILAVLLGFTLIAILGRLFQKKSALQVFGGSLLAATAFYFLTNSLAWAVEPGYPKSPAGYLQALWTGLPGFSPTWTFFRNSLLSTALFTALFLVPHRKTSPANSTKLASDPATNSAV